MKDKKNKNLSGGEYTWCPGKRAVEELILHRPHRIIEVLLTKDSALTPLCMEKLSSHQIPVQVIGKDEFLTCDPSFESINHQWISAKITRASSIGYQQIFDKVLKEEHPLVIVLDQIQDPQNLGAIFRVCECGGVSALMLTSKRSAHVSPLVRKISAGATEFIPFSEINNLAQVISHAKEKGFWVYGASLSPRSEELYSARIHQPTMLIMGSEHSGLRKQTEALCDQLIYIPQYGSLQSMNVVSSTAVLVFELQRRLRYEKGKM